MQRNRIVPSIPITADSEAGGMVYPAVDMETDAHHRHMHSIFDFETQDALLNFLNDDDMTTSA